MKFKTGLVVGFGAGYVLGSKAGRERYDQIQRWFDGFMSNDQVQRLGTKGVAVADIAGQRARGILSDGFDAAARKAREVADR